MIELSIFIFSQDVYSQVSKYQSIERVGKENFNIVTRAGRKYEYEKDKSVRLVFSDREDNTAYLDAYGQKKGDVQKFLTPYLVIDSKNGFCELVEASPNIIGRPKGLFSCLFSKKNHFRDTKGLKYIGWIPFNNLVWYPKSLIDAENNRPLKYKVGFQAKSLFDLHKYLNKDSLTVYKDPLLKIKSHNVFLTNQVVYPYKYSLTKKTVFVSNKPILKDTVNQISGWIPSDFIFPIGQNKVFKLNDSLSFDYINTEKKDTLLVKKDLYSKYLYDDSFNVFKGNDTITTLSVPIYVWNHRENKLINIDGNDILVSEVDRLKRESKTLNFHFIFNGTDRTKINLLISSMQRIWVSLSQVPKMKLTFSSICVGKKSFILPKTDSFAQWIDFMQKLSKGNHKNIQIGKELNIAESIDKMLSEKSSVKRNFENNFFIIMGSQEQIDLSNYSRLMNRMASKSSALLFVQTNNRIDNSYQNYILRAKETMAVLGESYNSFIRRYTVDNSLVVQNNSLKNIESEKDNIYIYDAPINSRFNGGIVFPKINETLAPISLNIAIDSVLNNIQKNNELLISSLENYKSKLSVLRSKPTDVLRYLFRNDASLDTLSLSKIDRNNVNEVFYKHFGVDKETIDTLEEGYIFSKEELQSLIEDYRMLLPYFSKGLQKEEKRILLKMYKNQIRGINKSFRRKVLSKCKSTVGELFYYKTGIPVTETILDTIKVSEIRKEPKGEENIFSEIYLKLLEKLNVLEEKIQNNQLEITEDNRYYLPKEMLL